MTLPARIDRKSHRQDIGRRCPGHRAWVRGHACSACASTAAIECAHVRGGTDGGAGLKPSDKWAISLCRFHHFEQHQIGETIFAAKHDIVLLDLANEFAARSPFLRKLRT